MQHCFADNMVDGKLYVIVIVIAQTLPRLSTKDDSSTTDREEDPDSEEPKRRK